MHWSLDIRLSGLLYGGLFTLMQSNATYYWEAMTVGVYALRTNVLMVLHVLIPCSHFIFYILRPYHYYAFATFVFYIDLYDDIPRD